MNETVWERDACRYITARLIGADVAGRCLQSIGQILVTIIPTHEPYRSMIFRVVQVRCGVFDVRPTALIDAERGVGLRGSLNECMEYVTSLAVRGILTSDDLDVTISSEHVAQLQKQPGVYRVTYNPTHMGVLVILDTGVVVDVDWDYTRVYFYRTFFDYLDGEYAAGVGRQFRISTPRTKPEEWAREVIVGVWERLKKERKSKRWR